MKKYIIAVISIITLLCSVYVVLPFITINKIKNAYQEKNAEEFSKYVDFEALKKNIRTQIVMEMVEKEFKDDQDQASRAFVENIMGSFLDALISPNFVMLLFDSSENATKKEDIAQNSQENLSENSAQSQEKNTEIAKKSQENPFNEAKYGFSSFNKFHVILVNKKDNSEIKIILIRKKIDWKVSEIQFPKGFFEGKI